MTSKFLVSMLAVGSACTCFPTAGSEYSNLPFACNLKAFTAQERAHQRALSDQLMPAVRTIHELKDGYELQVDAHKMSLVDVAQWVDLEQKCCPFFDFELDLHGQDGALFLSLKGREGVKQFIEMDFTRLRDKLPHRDSTR